MKQAAGWEPNQWGTPARMAGSQFGPNLIAMKKAAGWDPDAPWGVPLLARQPGQYGPNLVAMKQAAGWDVRAEWGTPLQRPPAGPSPKAR
jgi:hypothetical protein